MKNLSANSLLAKLLATENITVQQQSGIKTAMFDLKNRVLMLPLWQDISIDLEHLLIGHETGHALDTPSAEEYKQAYEKITKNIFGVEKISERLASTVRGFLNVIEDARIDKRQKRRYPGLRKNYLLGYKELIDRDFFGTNGRDINGMNFIDRLNIYFKGGNIHLNIEFSPEERSLLKRVENLEKFDDVITLTEEIYRFCKGKIENEETDIGIIDNDDSDDGELEMDYDGDDWDDGDENDDDGDGDSEDGESEGTTTSKGEGDLGDNGSGRETTGSGAGAGSENDEVVPESLTDKAWEEKSQSLIRNENCDYVYVTMPDVDWKKAVHDYKRVLSDWDNELLKGWYGYGREKYNECRREMMEWRQKEKDTISFLVKEFEQRKAASEYSRIQVAKTGVIDTNKLHSYKYNDDIFRRLSILPQGKNHGFVMFLDWSGSMTRNLKHTMRQLFTLVMFCKQIQVPFDVYAFKDSSNNKPWIVNDKKNCLRLGHVTLRQFLSSKMNVSEMNNAFTHLWYASHHGHLTCDGLSGTPLNEAVILAPKIVNDFRSKHKLEIVNTIFITDGESDGLGGLENETFGGHSYQSIGNSIRQRRYFYTDKVSGRTFDIYPYSWGSMNTTTLLKVLKSHTGCNLIGFFLFGETWSRFSNRFLSESGYDYRQKVAKFWKDNKFYPVKTEGYDDYYVIDTKSLRNDSNDLAIDNSKSTKQMAKAFSKFASKKKVNRVLLRNFIDHITETPKKVA